MLWVLLLLMVSMVPRQAISSKFHKESFNWRGSNTSGLFWMREKVERSPGLLRGGVEGRTEEINIHYHIHELVISDEEKECLKEKHECKTDSQCCEAISDFRCIRGECAKCQNENHICHTDQDCCYPSKFHCRRKVGATAGSQGTCQECTPSGKTCKRSADCCNKNDRCSPAGSNSPRQCLPCGTPGVRELCNGHRDCCPGKKCGKNKQCVACKSLGDSCTNVEQCCTYIEPAHMENRVDVPEKLLYAFCRDGKCQKCVSTVVGKRQGCRSNEECCHVAGYEGVSHVVCSHHQVPGRPGQYTGKRFCEVPENCQGDGKACNALAGLKCCDRCECKYSSTFTATHFCSCH